MFVKSGKAHNIYRRPYYHTEFLDTNLTAFFRPQFYKSVIMSVLVELRIFYYISVYDV